MEHLGPGEGRERSPESIAQEIMEQSDEGVGDFLGGTEITDGDDAEADYGAGESPADDLGGELDFDDGGDYSDF